MKLLVDQLLEHKIAKSEDPFNYFFERINLWEKKFIISHYKSINNLLKSRLDQVKK